MKNIDYVILNIPISADDKLCYHVRYKSGFRKFYSACNVPLSVLKFIGTRCDTYDPSSTDAFVSFIFS